MYWLGASAQAGEAPPIPLGSVDFSPLSLPGQYSANLYDGRVASSLDDQLAPQSAFDLPDALLSSDRDLRTSTFALSPDVRLHFGQAVLDSPRPAYAAPEFSGFALADDGLLNPRQAETNLAGVDWGVTSWSGLGIVATRSSVQDPLLSGFSSNALAKSANTSTASVSAHVAFGGGWVTTFSYNEGITQLDLKPNSLVGGSDSLHSRALGISVAKHGLFGDDDSLGLAVSRPLQEYSSGVNFAAADGWDAASNLKIGGQYGSLANDAPETDLELGYVTTFMDGALALQANAGYQLNVAGLGGTNAMSVISRAKINF